MRLPSQAGNRDLHDKHKTVGGPREAGKPSYISFETSLAQLGLPREKIEAKLARLRNPDGSYNSAEHYNLAHYISSYYHPEWSQGLAPAPAPKPQVGPYDQDISRLLHQEMDVRNELRDLRARFPAGTTLDDSTVRPFERRLQELQRRRQELEALRYRG